MIKILRLTFFIPLGLLSGILMLIPIEILLRLALWWIGGTEEGGMAAMAKGYTPIYFAIIFMAWIAPPFIGCRRFKYIVSLLFGIYVVWNISRTVDILSYNSGEMSLTWRYWILSFANLLGYLHATFWSNESISLLVADAKGAHPFNVFGKSG